MSIKKVGPSKWLVRVTMLDETKGYPVCKQETINGNQADAKAREVELLREQKGRSLTTVKSINTFSDAIDLYVARLDRLNRISRSHRTLVEKIRKDFGDLPIRTVPDRFSEWLNYFVTTPGEKTGRMRSAASINRHVSVVKAIFSILTAQEFIEKNPITALRFPKYKEEARDRYLNDEERARLLSAVEEHKPYLLPIVMFMLFVPCRVSELTNAKREQYNRFTGTIYIPDSKAGIPIHKPVPEEMRDYFNSVPQDCPWLFYWIDEQSKYRQLLSIRKPWQSCLKKAGLNNLRVHDLRHISATDLYEAGNPEREIMDIAGWRTPMLSHYRHKNSLRSAQKIIFKRPKN